MVSFQFLVSMFELTGKGFRSVDPLTEVVGSLQFGEPAVHTHLLAAVWDYLFSKVFGRIILPDFCLLVCTKSGASLKNYSFHKNYNIIIYCTRNILYFYTIKLIRF